MATEPAKITHLSIVVKDARKTMQLYHDILGWGPWSAYILKPPRHDNTMLHGKPTQFSMVCVSTEVGGINFELIEPLEGPSVYKEFLEKHGEGFQHMGCWQWLNEEDAHAKMASLKSKGLEVAMSGRIDGHVEYHYFDTEPGLKIYVEVAKSDVPSIPPDWTWP